jgi:tetratricopeptide (TPR) repeat protein
MIYQEESVALLREYGPLAGIYNVLNSMASISIWHGKYTAALSILNDAKKIETELGQRGSSYTYFNQGRIYYRLGDYSLAQKHLEKTIFLSRQTGDNFMIDWASSHLGYVFLEMGLLDHSRETFIQCMKRFKEADILIGVVFAIEGLASLNTLLSKAEKATKLFAWSDKTREELNSPRPPIEKADVELRYSTLASVLGDEEFSAAYDEGIHMTLKQAMIFARE